MFLLWMFSYISRNLGKLQENCKFLQLPAQIIFMMYTKTRYSTIKLYVASSQNGTALAGKNGNGSSNLGSGSTLTVSRDQSGHSSAYKHFYRGDLYGSSSGTNVPIVETKYLNIS